MLEHPFDPIVDENCQVLVLGSFPSVQSRENGFYYGHPRNRFWPMIAKVYGEPLPAERQGRAEMLLRHHIALWDTALRCDVSGSMDSGIRNVVPTDLTAVLKRADISRVLLNGRLAGRVYQSCQEAGAGLTGVVLPSTSPANAAWSLDRLCAIWSAYLPDPSR